MYKLLEFMDKDEKKTPLIADKKFDDSKERGLSLPRVVDAGWLIVVLLLIYLCDIKEGSWDETKSCNQSLGDSTLTASISAVLGLSQHEAVPTNAQDSWLMKNGLLN